MKKGELAGRTVSPETCKVDNILMVDIGGGGVIETSTEAGQYVISENSVYLDIAGM